ncbi:unnamed protein product [Arabidopsis thaliana]|uniref:Emb/CAB85503.1 n=2 Tax=Arabidopsis thaliana TaxID=3702 RepID=Q9LZC4_ARATH|nr:unnamed protein product [Arabidopsis thaliana]CAB85503.1 putative protein [Arabidopsis thaliana]
MPRRPSGRRRLSKYKPLAFSSFIRSLAFASTARRKLPLPDMSFDEKFHNLSKKGKEKSSLESSDEEDSQGDVQAGFVDLILNQTALGTVVKVADDEDEALFALITALNLARYKASHLVEVLNDVQRCLFVFAIMLMENKCFRELKEFLLKVCSEKNVASDLELLLEKKAKDVGLLVSQRVMNLPLQLLPPLYDGLFDEVSWATEDEPTEELRGSFRFKSYILIAKIYKLSSWSFILPMYSQLVTSQETQKIPEFRKKLKSLIDEQ